MNKRMTVFFLTAALVLTLLGCGQKPEEPAADLPGTAQGMEAEIIPQPEPPAEEEETFDFAAFAGLQFTFSSGAGGWATVMTIEADGSFSGQFHDSDMGVTGEGYPNGTMFISNFSGQFSTPLKVNDYTYSMQILELNYGEEFGTEEIRDGVLYGYGDAYGLEGTEEFLIYLPGAPLEELPEEFRSWVGYYDLSYTDDTELPFYALNNVDQQQGFSSHAIS